MTNKEILERLTLMVDGLNKATLKGCFNLQEATNYGYAANELIKEFKERKDEHDITD